MTVFEGLSPFTHHFIIYKSVVYKFTGKFGENNSFLLQIPQKNKNDHFEGGEEKPINLQNKILPSKSYTPGYNFKNKTSYREFSLDVLKKKKKREATKTFSQILSLLDKKRKGISDCSLLG